MKPDIRKPDPSTTPRAASLRLLPVTALVVSLLSLLSTATFLIFGYAYFSAALESYGDQATFTMMGVAGVIALISYPLSLVLPFLSLTIFGRTQGTDQIKMVKISIALTILSTVILSICLLLFILFCGIAISDFRWSAN